VSVVGLSALPLSSVAFGSSSPTSAPSQKSFQKQVEALFKLKKYRDPHGIHCVMPNHWIHGSKFRCTVTGETSFGSSAVLFATITSKGATLAAPMQIAAGCQADVATVQTAVAAFSAENKGVIPTEALVLSKSDHGPFLSMWPNGSPNYSISLSSGGTVMIAIPSSATPKVANLKACVNILTTFATLPK